MSAFNAGTISCLRSVKGAARKLSHTKDMKTRKVGHLRRWSNEMLKEAQFVGKLKMASGSGAARKSQAGLRGNYECLPRWFDKLTKVCKTALPERYHTIG